MVMGEATTTSRRISATHITRARQATNYTLQEKSGGENTHHQMAESPVYSPQERLSRRQAHHGPISPQYVYTLSDIQDVDNEGDKDIITKTLLDGIPRSDGRILAYSYNS